MPEHPFVLGSAGHIDHGKTTLVQALTGVDCDSLVEEKRRGITIELGFAALDLPSGRTVSIVDVPGHERFIRQMAAGAAGVDAAMLIVAADEGVMPQTREHLDILSLLGVNDGVVVLTKADLVDEEMLELAADDVRSLVQGTFLQDSPIIPVSGVTGEGLDKLTSVLDELVMKTPSRDRNGAFFMPIDRTFSMRGFGSVVTGTAYQGSIQEGEDVDIVPAELTTKIRSIQVHGIPSECAIAGQRTALNLASVSMEQLRRGDAVCAKDRFRPSECLDVLLNVLPTSPEPIFHWQRLRLHIGTADLIARVSLYANARGERAHIPPDGRGMAQLLPETPVAVSARQRFVVRFYSPLVTIGGGMVLLPNSERVHSRDERDERMALLEELAADFTDEAFLLSLIRLRGALDESRLFALSQMGTEVFELACSNLARGCRGICSFFSGTQRFYMSKRRFDRVAEAIIAKLQEYHRMYPERSGLDADELHSALGQWAEVGFDLRAFKGFIQFLVADGCVDSTVAQGGTRYCSKGFRPRTDASFSKLIDDIRTLVSSAGWELPEMSVLPALFGVSAAQIGRAVGYLRENDGWVVVGDGLLLSMDTMRRACELLESLEGDITIATTRDAMGTSRKYALAILEFFDSQGVTRRVGDKRMLLRGRKDFLGI